MSYYTDHIDAMRQMADWITAGEITVGTQPANAATMDFNTVQVKAVKGRLLYVVVSTTLTWVSTGQATVQLFASRAAGQNPAANPSTCFLIGATSNFGASGTSITAPTMQIYSSTQLAELANSHPFLGVRAVFTSALTAGAFQPYLETSGA